MTEENENLNLKENLRKMLLQLSKRKAASPSQLSFILGINPSESISLTRHLVTKGLVDGPTSISGDVLWNKYYSLSLKGLQLTQSIEEEEEFL